MRDRRRELLSRGLDPPQRGINSLRDNEVANPSGYEPVIGLEVHAQLKTESKMFCGCAAGFGEAPNTRTCPVCLGLPGALPVTNQTAVELGAKAAIALGGQVNRQSVFARKNYFYPDLPKGYQITQYDRPLADGGQVTFQVGQGIRAVRLRRIHLEEDAGKLLHEGAADDISRLDLNRCGLPLIEIVTEPDIATPQDAHAYLSALKQMLQYAGVSEADMEKGQLRCDANVSVRRAGEDAFGTRTEIKNMNSFKAVERALQFEIDRQIALLERGEKVTQATLLWDEHRRVAEPMRTKEDSPDYRYFPEPDLPPVILSEDKLAELAAGLPEMPSARRQRLVEQYGIREYDAEIIVSERALADYYEATVAAFPNGQAVANFILTDLLGRLRELGRSIAECEVPPWSVAGLLDRVERGVISLTAARALLDHPEIGKRALDELIVASGVGLVSDEATLAPLVDHVIEAHPAQVAEYRDGKAALIGFFMGQAMRATDNRADAAVLRKLVERKLKG